MKTRDLANLLNRAAAVIEDPASETASDRADLIAALTDHADALTAEPAPVDRQQEQTRAMVIRYHHDQFGERGFIRYSETAKKWKGATASGTPCSFNMLGVPNDQCEALSVALDRALTPSDLYAALNAHTYRGSAYTLI